MQIFRLLFAAIVILFPAFTFSQDTLTVYEKEILSLQKLQTELLETRLSILESRIEKLAYQSQTGDLERQMAGIRDEIRLTKDSLKRIRDVVYGLQVEKEKSKNKINHRFRYPVPDVVSVYGIQPIKLLQGNFEMTAGYKLGNAWSGQLSLMGTYVSRGGMGGNYLKSQDLEYFSPMSDSWEKYNGQMFTGFGAELSFSNYLLNRLDSSEKAPLGLYAGPVLNYRYVRIRGEEVRWDGGFSEIHEVNRHLGVIGLGFTLGYRLPVYSVLALDVYVGGILRLSKYAGEKHLTRYKKWNNIDYSGVMPTAGIRICILK